MKGWWDELYDMLFKKILFKDSALKKTLKMIKPKSFQQCSKSYVTSELSSRQ